MCVCVFGKVGDTDLSSPSIPSLQLAGTPVHTHTPFTLPVARFGQHTLDGGRCFFFAGGYESEPISCRNAAPHTYTQGC